MASRTWGVRSQMPPVSVCVESTFPPMFCSAVRFQAGTRPSESVTIVAPFIRSASEWSRMPSVSFSPDGTVKEKTSFVVPDPRT